MTEGPYKLPEGWRWVRLGEVAHRKATLVKPSDYPSQRFRYLGMEHVAPGQWEEPRPVELDGKEIKSQTVIFRPGLVLYGKLRPYLNKVVVPRSEGVASTEFVPIEPDDTVLAPEYLGAFLRTPRFVEYASSNTTGSRQPRTRLDALWDAPIPLPPLAEQRRIVARIEALMARVREARRLRQAAREEAERLWQSVLTDTFPRPGSPLPPGWRWVRLGEVAYREANFLMPSDYPTKRFRYVGMEHLEAGQWAEPQGVEVSGAEIRSQVVFFRPGLFLYGKLRPYLNKVFVPRYEGVASTEFVPIAPRMDVLSPEYMGAYLRTPQFVAYAIANTTGSRQPRTRLDALWSAPIPLPPLAEQRRIVERLEALQEKLRALRAAQAETEEELKRLEQSILDKAFRGQL
jgi:type I restriction enzyme S subunit